MDFRYAWKRVLAKIESVQRDEQLLGLAEQLRGLNALEIGGPTSLFAERGRIPVYPKLRSLEACNFATVNLWDGAVTDLSIPVHSFVAEAGALTPVADERYDVVLASHVVEHLANPIGALREWRRVVKEDGQLLLVVPHRDGTFDHRRPSTSLEHLRSDAALETGEDDATHVAEALRLTDLRRDPGKPEPVEFRRRCVDNLRYRALHHHVFHTRSVISMCCEADWNVTFLACRRPYHIICLAGRTGDALGQGELNTTLAGSPFPSDRAGVHGTHSQTL